MNSSWSSWCCGYLSWLYSQTEVMGFVIEWPIRGAFAKQKGSSEQQMRCDRETEGFSVSHYGLSSTLQIG